MQRMSRYPYYDRNPCIVAAGKPIGNPCENVKDLFTNISLQDKVDAIRKQFGFMDAKDYGTDFNKASDIDTSGAFTEIRHCLRRPTPTFFEALDEEIKNTIYDSFWNKPLGKSRDPTPGLPAGMKSHKVIFGKTIMPSEPASTVINPCKKAEQSDLEEKCFHDLYAFTHTDYYPGEQVRQGYKSPFNENNVFGRPSKQDRSGGRAKRGLTWFNNDSLCHVSRRQAAVRNRTSPPLGKALDKTGVTDLFPVDHTFGKPSVGDFYGVGDLLNECTPSLMRRDMMEFLAYANFLRQNFYKKINAGDIALEELYQEIIDLNEKKDGGTCSVNFDCIDRVLKRHRIYLDRSKLEPFLIILGLLSEDGSIKVRDFINFIDKNARFPELKREHYIFPPEFRNYRFRSEFDCPREGYDVASMPPAGMPSVRTDKAQPVYIESFVNIDHLSEETAARALISPSIYTQYGLSHRDFFKPRSKEFLGSLFSKIGVTLSEEDLKEIYKEGLELDKTGQVCVETFRNILDKRAYYAFNRIENKITSE